MQITILSGRNGRIKKAQVTSQIPLSTCFVKWPQSESTMVSLSEIQKGIPIWETLHLRKASCPCANQEHEGFKAKLSVQHCCSWQEHGGRAMETWCQRSEDLNHPPILLLSRTPQCTHTHKKKKQREPTESEWLKDSEWQKNKIK